MNENLIFWITKLSDPNEAEDEVLASIDMLVLIMDEEAVPHLLHLMMEDSQSQKVKLSAAEAVAAIAGEKSRNIILAQRKKLTSSAEIRLFDVALTEGPH